MLSVAGDALALLLIAGVLALGWLTWRRPFLGLGFLVAGMAFHNFVIMGLLQLGTSHVLVRAVQAWKEAILALLLAIALVRLWRAYQEHGLPHLMSMDWLAIAFTVIVVAYLLIPNEVLGGHASLGQRLAAFRVAALMPLLYAFGRTYRPAKDEDVASVAWLIVGAGAVVGAFGLVELFLVPTRDWLSWGVNQFSAWLGFHYGGPQGLPDNFFQTMAPDAYLRRMVSTYISPLGIAYTGLLVFPLAVVLLDAGDRRRERRVLAAIVLALVLAGILLSVTRLALFALVGEAVLMATFMRRWWLNALLVLVLIGVVAVIFGYPRIGPVLDSHLQPTQVRGGIVSASDPSFLEHIATVLTDLKVAVAHPLGEGLGSAGSPAVRFAGAGSSADYAPGESSVLTMFVDTGVIGGVAYVALYVFGLIQAVSALLRTHRRGLEAALPMVAVVGGLALVPITMTNDLWGDFSVTFLFWWAVGSCASAAFGYVPARDVAPAARTSIASS